MNIQEWALDRIEQSFDFMKKNFIKLILPLFIYNFIFFWVIYLFVMNYISWFIWNLGDFNSEWLLQILYSAEWVLVIAIMMFLWLLNALLYIPIFIASIRSIHQAAMQGNITMNENIVFWFKNILNSFSTYWYIFKYIYLIPAIIFIIWWIWFNLIYFLKLENELLKNISIWFMIIAFILFIIFSIYRWLKAKFVLYSAISNESFTQKDFDLNIKITKNNLWRIFWNFFLLWMILWFVSRISWFISNIFLPSSVDTGLDKYVTLDNFIKIQNWVNPMDIIKVDEIEVTFSQINFLINTFVWEFLSALIVVFWFVFTYIFMKRLELESKENLNLEIINKSENQEIASNNKIEL